MAGAYRTARSGGRLVAGIGQAPDGPGDPTPPHWGIAVSVVDIDATALQASALGGAVLLAPVDTPGFRSAVIADPQGGTVAITAPRMTA